MSLPEILVPAGVAPFRATGHAFRRGALHVDLPRGTGHARKRPKRTAASHIISVSARVSKDAAQAFENWYENTLQVGTLPFAANVFGLETPAPVWWSATWESPPKWDVGAGSFWIVSGQLRVTGKASLTGPVSTSAAVEFAASLVGTATPVISNDAQAEFTAALRTAALGSVEFRAALAAVINGAPASAIDFEKRWIWMRYPYARGRSADVTDTSEFDQRSWMGI